MGTFFILWSKMGVLSDPITEPKKDATPILLKFYKEKYQDFSKRYQKHIFSMDLIVTRPPSWQSKRM